MDLRRAGIWMSVSQFLPTLLAIGLMPCGMSLLLFVVTRIEGSLPPDRGGARR
jgi:hypothetical protein